MSFNSIQNTSIYFEIIIKKLKKNYYYNEDSKLREENISLANNSSYNPMNRF